MFFSFSKGHSAKEPWKEHLTFILWWFLKVIAQSCFCKSIWLFYFIESLAEYDILFFLVHHVKELDSYYFHSQPSHQSSSPVWWQARIERLNSSWSCVTHSYSFAWCLIVISCFFNFFYTPSRDLLVRLRLNRTNCTNSKWHCKWFISSLCTANAASKC